MWFVFLRFILTTRGFVPLLTYLYYTALSSFHYHAVCSVLLIYSAGCDVVCVVMQRLVTGAVVDVQSGSYHDPSTGEVMPLSPAVQRGLVSAADVADSDAVDRASGRWGSTSDFSEANIAVGSRPVGSRESLTRTVETKTVVDISSLPRRTAPSEALSATVTGSRSAPPVANGVGPEPGKGVDELDDLIAKMKESADWTMDEGSSGIHASASGLSQRRYENGGIVTSTVTSSIAQSSTRKTRVNEPTTFEETVNAGFADITSGLAADLFPGGQQVTSQDAVKTGLVVAEAGAFVSRSVKMTVTEKEQRRKATDYSISGGEIGGEEAAVISQTRTMKPQRPVTLDNALTSGLIDAKTGLVTDPSTGRKISISAAVAAGIIDGEASMLVDPATGRPVSLAEGLRSGMVDGRTGSIVRLDTGETVSFSEAAQNHLIVAAAAGETVRPTMAVDEWARSGLSSGLLAEPVSGRQMTLQHAGLPDHSPPAERPTGRVADGVNGALPAARQHTAESAPSAGQPPASAAVVDATQVVSCRSSSQSLSVCSDAVHAVTALRCVELTSGLMLSVLQNETGDVSVHDGQQTAVSVAAQGDAEMEIEGTDEDTALQIVEPSDLLSGKNELDKEQPKLAPASSMTLLEAVSSGLADSTSGLFEDPHTGKKVPLREAIELSLITTGKMVVTDTARDETVSLQESVHRQIVDADLTTFVDTQAGRQLTFADAIREGFIREDDRIPTLSELAADGLYDPSTGTVVDVSTGQRVSLLEAIESKLLDRLSVSLLDPATGAKITLAEAFERGILDPDTGKLVNTYTGQTMNLVDSVNKAVLGVTTTCSAEARPPAQPHGPSVADKRISLDGSEQKYAAEPSRAVENVKEGLKTYSITDAIREGIYDPKTNTVVDPVSGQHMSLEQALDFGLIDASRAMVRDVHSGQKVAFEVLVEMGLIDISSGMVRDSQGRDIPLEDAVLNGLMFENPPLSTPLTLLQLIDEGLFKVETSEFFDPSSSELVSLHEAMSRSLLDPQSIVVHEIGSSEVLGIQDAIHVGVVDAEAGHVRDNSSREVISLADALDRNIVLCKPLPIVTAIDVGLLNETTAKFLDPSCRKFFSLAAAVESGLIDSDSCFTDPATGRPISVALAMSRGVLDAESACVTNVHTGDVMTLREAITAAKLMPASAGKLMSVDEAISLGLFDQSSNVFLDPHTREELTLEAAVAAGLLDGNSVMTDAATGRKITVAEMLNETPLKVEIEEEDKGQRHVKGKEAAAAAAAAAAAPQTGQVEQQADTTVAGTMSGQGDGRKLNMPLHTVLQMGLFSEDSGQVEHPETHELMSVQVAFDSGLVDSDSVKFKDLTARLLLSFKQSVESELVDAVTGDVVSPEGDTLTLKEAVGEGLVITATTDKGLSLVDVVQQGVYDPVSGRLTHPFSGAEMTVQEGMETGLIDTKKTRVCVPDHEEMSTDKAVSQNLINTVTGRFEEPDSGESLTLGEAITKSYLVEVKLTNLSVDEAVDRGIFDVTTGVFVDPVTGKQMNITEAIRSGLLDPRQTLLTCLDGSKMLTLDEAIAVGMVDANTGELINVHTGQRMSFVEATDKGLVLDTYVPPMMSFSEACRKGLFDRRTGNFSHPVTGTRMNFEAAISSGLIDPEKCRLILPGSGEPSTLAAAIDENLIDDKFVNIVDPSQRHSALLVDALSDARLAPDEYQHQAISAKGTTPAGDAETLHASGREVSEVGSEKLAMDTIAAGDGSSSPAAVEGSTDSQVPLHLVSTESADVRHDWLCAVRGMTLCAVVNSDLFDRDTCSLLRPSTDTRVSLTDAAVLGILDLSNVAVHNFVIGRVLDFHAACENGLVDLIKGSVYYPAGGSWLGLVDAIDQGIVFDTREGQTTLSELVDRGLFDVTSGMFVDPHTKVMMSLQQSVECGLLSTKKLLLVLPETHEGFTLQFAISRGLADTEQAVITSPLTGKRFRLVDLCGEVMTAGGLTLKQAAVQGLLNAESRRVLHPVTGHWLTLAQALDAGLISAAGTLVKDCRTGDLISLGAAIEAQLVDTVTADMIDVTTGVRTSLFDAVLRGLGLSVQEAVSAGLFNSETGRFVNPDTNEEMTLREAVDAGMIDAASSFMVDADTGLTVSLAEALSRGMVDSVTGSVIDMRTGIQLGLRECVECGLLVGDPADSVTFVTEQQNARGHVAGVVDSMHLTGLMPECVDVGRELTDLQHGIAVKEPVSASLPDESAGFVTTHTEMTVREVSGKQVFMDEHSSTKITREVEAQLGVTFPEKGTLQKMTVGETVEVKLAEPTAGRLIDTRTDGTLPLEKTLQAGIVNGRATKVHYSKRKMILDEALRNNLLDSSTGLVTDPLSGRKVTLSEAVKAGIIDAEASSIVNPSTGQTVSLTEGLRLGIVDGKSGKVVDRTTGRTFDLDEAVKSASSIASAAGADARVSKPKMTLDEAVRSNLLDISTGLIIDPSSGQQMTVIEAVKAGIIDADASSIVNPSTGQTVSLTEGCLLYTSPCPRDRTRSRMPSSA